MSDRIKHAVLFTVRDIEGRSFFQNVDPQISQVLIDFFVKLNDEFSHWLKDKVHLSSFKQTKNNSNSSINMTIPDDVKQNANKFEDEKVKVFEERSLVDSIVSAKDLEDLQAIKASFFHVFQKVDDKDNYYLINNFLSQIPDANPIEEETNAFANFTYNDSFGMVDLDGPETHIDKVNPKVKDRLGWYRKEDEGDGHTVACAVYPWSGKMNSEHNNRWARTLISTIKNEYHSLESILLVCHDKDFIGYRGKNDVITSGKFFDNLHKEFPILKGIIVFQHNRSPIILALNKENAKDVYDEIDKYVTGFNKIKTADNNNENATAHKSFGGNKREGEMNS